MDYDIKPQSPTGWESILVLKIPSAGCVCMQDYEINEISIHLFILSLK